MELGPIYINVNGYGRLGSDLDSPITFVSTVDCPYIIKDQQIDYCDNIINVYQTDSNIKSADIYIKLSTVYIEADVWCSLFRIVATNYLNIYLLIEGEVDFVGGDGQQIFSSQGNGGASVIIIINESTYGGYFNAESPDGLTYKDSGSINIRDV